jgi:hypothetical protein
VAGQRDLSVHERDGGQHDARPHQRERGPEAAPHDRAAFRLGCTKKKRVGWGGVVNVCIY